MFSKTSSFSKKHVFFSYVFFVKRTRFKKKNEKKKTIYITRDRVWGECGEVRWGVEIGEGRGTGVWGKVRGHEGCKEVWESVWR